MILVHPSHRLDQFCSNLDSDSMTSKRPPGFLKTVGRSAFSSAGLTGGAAGIDSASAADTAQSVPLIFIPGMGSVPLRGGATGSAMVPTPPLTQTVLPSSMKPGSTCSGIPPKQAVDRPDAPAVKRVCKASVAGALEAASTDANKAAALEILEFDKVANSARSSRASIWATWKRLHVAWHGPLTPVLPLTVLKIKSVAAMFKAGNYVSFANYASRAKAEHIDQFGVHQCPWTEELTVELKGAIRSITRGRGPAKQSYPVDLTKVLQLGDLSSAVVENGPVGVTDLFVLATFFMARELEVACARCSNFHVDILAGEVTWNMPVAKNDVMALGTHRTWGCLCGSSAGVGCPFHSALRQFERVRPIALEVGCSLADLPFFPNALGAVVDKKVMVATINKVMELCKLPVKDATDRPLYGGHSWRTAGAVLLAGLGIDTARIEAMARWNSPMLLYYIRAAPVRTITKEFKLLDKAQAARLGDGGAQVTAKNDLRLNKVIVELAARLDKAEAFANAGEDRLASLELQVAPIKFVRNVASGIWHQTLEHTAGAICTTNCGWQYTGMRFESVSFLDPSLSHKELCGTCLPALRLRASMD